MTVLEAGRTEDVTFAEKSVLGAMITSQHAAETVLGILDRDDCFTEAGHQAVFAAVRHVTENGTPAEPQAVLARLVAAEPGVWRTGQAGVILSDLIAHASPSYVAHAHAVLRAARQRRVLAALDTARQAAALPDFDPDEGTDLIRKLLDDALGGPQASTACVTAADLFTSAVDRLEAARPPGVIRFPWDHLRDLVPWLRPGQLITVAARPSLGKSLFGGDLARYAGMHMQIPVALFTMEMDRDEVMDRFMSAEAGVLLKRIIDCALNEADWQRIAETTPRFANSKIVIDDTPKATLAHIRARLRGMARQEPAQLAIVDYLQLMAGPPGKENRQQEVSALVAGLKAIAREFRIPVVMLCQLNRLPESRADKRPYLSDARESGSVENDTDVAILIHRPDFHDLDSPRAGEADLIVDKNRNGPRGTVTIGFQGHFARFVDPQPRPWTPVSALERQPS